MDTPEAEQGMKFPTCLALSRVLALRDAAAVPSSRTLFDAIRRAQRVAGDAGVVDVDGVDRPRGDGRKPGVLVLGDAAKTMVTI